MNTSWGGLCNEMIDPTSEYEKAKLDRHKVLDATMPKEQTQPQENRIALKHSRQGIGRLYVQSFGKRKKKEPLTDEDKTILSTYFNSSGEGVSKVDESVHYYQDGSFY